jgi:uncharacterized OsmC-like protein
MNINTAEKIKQAMERCRKALSLKPSLGRDTAVSRVRVMDGLACEVTEGKWTFRLDMPESAGGAASGPTPGVFGRAALGSCLAMGYIMKAAEMNIPIRGLEVEVQADYDDGPLFGTASDAPAGYSEVRYTVTVNSEAPEEKITMMLNEADRLSPYLDVFSRAQNCKRQIKLVNT